MVIPQDPMAGSTVLSGHADELIPGMNFNVRLTISTVSITHEQWYQRWPTLPLIAAINQKIPWTLMQLKRLKKMKYVNRNSEGKIDELKFISMNLDNDKHQQREGCSKRDGSFWWNWNFIIQLGVLSKLRWNQ